MILNQNGLDLIKRNEGCKLKAYRCPAGILTIGYGHTGDDVTEGMVIDQNRADFLLKNDLIHFCTGVENLIEVNLNDNQFSALVSFAYNCGLGNLMSSTLLHMVNQEDPKASCQFLKWNRAAGKVLPGLVKRRQEEKDLFDKV